MILDLQFFGGRGASSMGGGSNKKYNGFSITNQKGETKHYIVVNGRVENANGTGTGMLSALGVRDTDVIQKVYDQEGSVKNVIKRVNSRGIGKASTLSDKNVEKMQKQYRNDREKARKQLESDAYKRKKGVNRHSAYWSAM